MYDIIGDIHGHAELLKKMLRELGYSKNQNVYGHPSRKAIFVGDFINRGNENRKSLKIIRGMVDNGNAYAILGNHEIYALLVSVKDKNRIPLIKSPTGSMVSAIRTINEFAKQPEEWKSYKKWMLSLPLFIEFEGLRIVHVCWSDEAIEILKDALKEMKLNKEVLRNLIRKPNSKISKSIQTVTKGIDFVMPGDLKIINDKGISPRSFRLRWWEDPRGKTFQEISFESKFNLPSYTVPEQLIQDNFVYADDNPIVFFGHYSRVDGPHIIKKNICCIDSWIAGSKTLTAYRWNGENALKTENLIQITI